MNGIHQQPRSSIGRLRSRIARFVDEHFVLVLLGPGLLAIFAIFIYPVLNLLYLSVHQVGGSQLGLGSKFIGFGHYERMFSSDQFWRYLEHTLFYSVGSLLVSISSGLLLALAINKVKNEWLRTTYGTLILVSWAIPVVVTALMWRWILHGQYGVLNMALVDLGIWDQPRNWLADGTTALVSVTLVDAWVRTPFATVIILAGLQSIPQEMYDAAKVDGATAFQAFRNVTVPYLRPSFAIVGLLNWMFAFRAFSIIWPLTGGGPGDATDVFATYIYRMGMVLFQQGYAAAIAMLLVVISLFVAIFYVSVVMTEIE